MAQKSRLKVINKYWYIRKFGNINLIKPIKSEINVEKDNSFSIEIKDLNIYISDKQLIKSQFKIKNNLEKLYNDLFLNGYELTELKKILKENFKKYL